MLRLGLCCIFRQTPIKFRTTTAAAVAKTTREEGRRKLADLCRANAEALLAAVAYCGAHGIGCFRINSQILPLKTHPQFGYEIGDLPGGGEIVARFADTREACRRFGVRLTMHPDQFVVLGSPNPSVVANSIAELDYQAEFATWTGVDVVNVHGGGAYGDKAAALRRFQTAFARLSSEARQRLTVENDDRIYTPTDLLPLCRTLAIPLVYDVHHHRCLTDGVGVETTTTRAVSTWGKREPLVHLSSPRDGWNAPRPHFHHDYIDSADFPLVWLEATADMTVEIEAKAKELAIEKLLSKHPDWPWRPNQAANLQQTASGRIALGAS